MRFHINAVAPGKLVKVLWAGVFFSLTVSAQTVVEDREPEAATQPPQQKEAFVAKEYMVVAANPYASWAGRNIIERGGSAIDAAVAVQAMLTLVEPQSSGIGGGAFILYWDNQEKELHTFDGRETAPAKVKPDWFLENGKPMEWIDAVVGGKSVGVPGALKALELAHEEFGTLPWGSLFEDAIETSDQGFKVSHRLASLLALDYHPGLRQFPVAASYFFPGEEPLQAGTLKRNRALAKTLRGIAAKGSDFLYSGELAEKIVKAVNTAPLNPGDMTLEDFRDYSALKREPVCGDYRKRKVCGMAPPSSGGISVLQILKLLEQKELSKFKPTSPEFAHLFTQASALAYADREMFIADTDFTQLPYAALINPSYLHQRAQQISAKAHWRKVKAGSPFAAASISHGRSLEQSNTSHISIVDKKGNAVSMTTSIEFMFGSGLMVDGFLLNNQLTDFSFTPDKNQQPVANRVEPNKRPRSAMSPTMVFNPDDELEIVVGSPGGSRIVSYVAQTLIGVIDYNLNIQQAISLPRITNRNDYTALEKGSAAEALQGPLKDLGHDVRIIDLNSGLHGIQILPERLIGGADPRREGVAVGR